MGAINEDSQWVHCPICDSKTRIKVCEDTVVQNFPLYCPKCKTEATVEGLFGMLQTEAADDVKHFVIFPR